MKQLAKLVGRKIYISFASKNDVFYKKKAVYLPVYKQGFIYSFHSVCSILFQACAGYARRTAKM